MMRQESFSLISTLSMMLRQKRNNFLTILCCIEIIISFLLKLYHRDPQIFNSNVSVSCVEEWFVEEKVVLLFRHI